MQFKCAQSARSHLYPCKHGWFGGTTSSYQKPVSDARVISSNAQTSRLSSGTPPRRDGLEFSRRAMRTFRNQNFCSVVQGRYRYQRIKPMSKPYKRNYSNAIYPTAAQLGQGPRGLQRLCECVASAIAFLDCIVDAPPHRYAETWPPQVGYFVRHYERYNNSIMQIGRQFSVFRLGGCRIRNLIRARETHIILTTQTPLDKIDKYTIEPPFKEMRLRSFFTVIGNWLHLLSTSRALTGPSSWASLLRNIYILSGGRLWLPALF